MYVLLSSYKGRNKGIIIIIIIIATIDINTIITVNVVIVIFENAVQFC